MINRKLMEEKTEISAVSYVQMEKQAEALPYRGAPGLQKIRRAER